MVINYLGPRPRDIHTMDIRPSKIGSRLKRRHSKDCHKLFHRRTIPLPIMTTRKAMQDDSWLEPLSQMEWFRPLSTFNQLLTRAMSIYVGEASLFLGIVFYVMAVEQILGMLLVDEELLEELMKRVQNGDELGDWIQQHPRILTTSCYTWLVVAFRGITVGAVTIAVAGIYCRERPNAQYCLKKALSNVGSLLTFLILSSQFQYHFGLFGTLAILFLNFTTPAIVIEGQDLISSFNRSRKVVMHSVFSTNFHLAVIEIITFAAFNLTVAVGENYFGQDFSMFKFSIQLFIDSMSGAAMAVVYLNMRTKYEGLNEAGLCRELKIDMQEEEDISKVDIMGGQDDVVTCSGLQDFNLSYDDNNVTKAVEGKASKLD